MCDNKHEGIAVWSDEDGTVFYDCPFLFIPDSVSNWLRRDKYYKEYSAPDYSIIPERHIIMSETYEKYLHYYNRARTKNA